MKPFLFLLIAALTPSMPELADGVVRDPQGLPVAGAQVVFQASPYNDDSAVDQRYFTGRTNEEGRFSIRIAPSGGVIDESEIDWSREDADEQLEKIREREEFETLVFRNAIALKPGVGFVRMPLNREDIPENDGRRDAFVEPDLQRPLEILLTRAEPLEVFVQDRAGRPVAGLDVFLCLENPRMEGDHVMHPALPPVRSNENGVALFDWFPESGIDACEFTTGEVPAFPPYGIPGGKTDYRELFAGKFDKHPDPELDRDIRCFYQPHPMRMDIRSRDMPSKPTIMVQKMIPVTVKARFADGTPAGGMSFRFFGEEIEPGEDGESYVFHREFFRTDSNGIARGLAAPGVPYEIRSWQEKHYTQTETGRIFHEETPPPILSLLVLPKTKITGTAEELYPSGKRFRTVSWDSSERDVEIDVLEDPVNYHIKTMDGEPFCWGFNFTLEGFRERPPRGGKFEGYLPPGKYRLKIDPEAPTPDGGETDPEIPSNARIITVTDQEEIKVRLFYLTRKDELRRENDYEHDD